MCVICVKPKSASFPSNEILSNCYDNNPDGAGIMYIKKGKVKIDKGFMNKQDFFKHIDKLKKEFKDYNDKEFIFHFRIATSGLTDKKTCHPFPISDRVADLQNTSLYTDLGVVHNGVIPEYVKGSKLSDSQNFVRDAIYPLYKLDKNYLSNKSLIDITDNLCGGKLALMNRKGYIKPFYPVGYFERFLFFALMIGSHV